MVLILRPNLRSELTFYISFLSKFYTEYNGVNANGPTFIFKATQSQIFSILYLTYKDVSFEV